MLAKEKQRIFHIFVLCLYFVQINCLYITLTLCHTKSSKFQLHSTKNHREQTINKKRRKIHKTYNYKEDQNIQTELYLKKLLYQHLRGDLIKYFGLNSRLAHTYIKWPELSHTLCSNTSTVHKTLTRKTTKPKEETGTHVYLSALLLLLMQLPVLLYLLAHLDGPELREVARVSVKLHAALSILPSREEILVIISSD